MVTLPIHDSLNESSTLLYDIGNFNEVMPNKSSVKFCVKNTHKPFLSVLLVDSKGHKLSQNIVSAFLANGENIRRTYLAWSLLKQAMFCIPCRLFNRKDAAHKSFLALPEGYSSSKVSKTFLLKLLSMKTVQAM